MTGPGRPILSLANARRIVSPVEDSLFASFVGAAGGASVRRRFLLPRLALDYLKVAREHAAQ